LAPKTGRRRASNERTGEVPRDRRSLDGSRLG
jgi:hypothetical protein